MRKELDKYLVEKYPKIFADRYSDMRETAMCWGFEHNEGWFWLLDQLCDSIQSYIDYNSKKIIIKNKITRNTVKLLKKISFKRGSKIKIIRKILNYRGELFYKIADFIQDKSKKIEIETIHQVVATQVKEKFGTLNFYYDGGDDYIRGMVWLAEKMSGDICEFCGSTKNVGHTKGWIYTICKKCYSKNERASQLQWKENQSRKSKLNMLNNISNVK